MTVIILSTYCIACGHTLKTDTGWCTYCDSDEYVIEDYEVKDRSR